MTPEMLPWVALVFGLVVGSFLNVAIHRLPLEGVSVNDPPRSRCPRCGHQLAWWENLPVLSWLLLRGRCRGCEQRISVRYPLVELLNGGLWWLAASRAGGDPWLALVWCVVLSGLVVATFVDFDCFEIPDEVSIGGMVLAPVASFLVPALHDETRIAQELTPGWSPGEPVDRLAALLASLAGIAVGAGVLRGIGWLGSRIWGRDAMGFGDVKLLGAGGGFVGPGGALVALMVGSLAASVAGLGNMLRFTWLSAARGRARGRGVRPGRALAVGRIAGRYLPFGPYLAIGIGIVLLAWNDVVRPFG
jgi:leader peptidase (prepilin peptidase)/N-methyltransferase